MKLIRQKPLNFQDRGSVSARSLAAVQTFQQRSLLLAQKIKPAALSFLRFLGNIKATGVLPAMDDYEKRKLGIFNQLNFFQFLAGVIVPIAGLLHHEKLPPQAWMIAGMPAIIPIAVLWLNSRHHHDIALITYFVLYPFATSIVYISGVNLGVQLSFVLYGILSVFFLQEISQMLFAVGLSMVNYFVLAVVCKNYTYQLETANVVFYFFNQLLAIAFIFYGLYLIKRENTGYQFSILQQKEKIFRNEQLLMKQTEELTELNAVKNKLFSVIAHDLKSPMYALRNMFRNMEQFDLPASEIKEMVPEVVNELNYTTSLMENLLQWARSQMQANSVKPQLIDVAAMMTDVAKLLRLQAEAKKIHIELKAEPRIYVYADKDMIDLVVRNLLSNAIKFTPEEGHITLGAEKQPNGARLFVTDSGEGISPEALEKINLNSYYTTKGTANESGTGLGLLLCREFLARNGGQMLIESEPGKGSRFSFTLPAKG
ncbi:MAG: HAMP domain-containing sensor histidine kinase [Bacteroidota bacterium]|nr:HAMP domain-containing sensor histidine kinase [Bacteroidota bacterium]MDP4253323.1 HAMP domain-containing sensor histidine kinase [Bacteroidota bacterium]MDP4257355.1 HAMP domain-containing sensor histidine kinase [Bacteroidota bacterium]